VTGVQRENRRAGQHRLHASLGRQRDRAVAGRFDVGARHAAEALIRDMHGSRQDPYGFGLEPGARELEIPFRTITVEGFAQHLGAQRAADAALDGHHVRRDQGIAVPAGFLGDALPGRKKIGRKIDQGADRAG
jgi:hypothetical protein